MSSASVVDPAVFEGGAAALVEALIRRAGDDAQGLARALSEERVPAAAVTAVVARLRPELAGEPAWAAAVAESRARADRVARAQALTDAALGPLAGGVALLPSPLGPNWARDVDVLATSHAMPEAARALAAAGFADLGALGGGDPGAMTFAAIEGRVVLAPVDLVRRLHAGGPSAEAILRRGLDAQREGLPRVGPADQLRRQAAKIVSARRVTVRDAIALSVLLETPTGVVRSRTLPIARHRCCELARALGAPAGPLEGGPRTRRTLHPVRARAVARGAVRRLPAPRRRVLVAFSGIDGSGKSTQAQRLVENLNRVGVPAQQVWARLGYSGSRPLTRTARLGQRILPSGAHSAQRGRAVGQERPDSRPLTRRGVLGWSWTLAVSVDYLRILRREIRQVSSRVVVMDRALPDALVALEEQFGGAVNLSLPRRLIIRSSPRPALTFYLRLPAGVARERKDDSFAAGVLDAHARRYEVILPRLAAVEVLDGQRHADDLAAYVFRRTAALG